MLGRKPHGAAVAGGQRSVLASSAAMPDRPHGMNDMSGQQSITFGDLGVAGGAAAKFAACGQQFPAGGAMDRTVDAAAAKQRNVRRIDDGIDIKCRDVGDDDVVTRRADLS